MKKQSKAQQKRHDRYLRLLKQSGFRSWKRASLRRGELIHKKVSGGLEKDEERELKLLLELFGAYADWKTDDALGKSLRSTNRKLAKMTPEQAHKYLSE